MLSISRNNVERKLKTWDQITKKADYQMKGL